MRNQTLLQSTLLLFLLIFSSSGSVLAAEPPAGACVERSFKQVKVVTPFSLTHRPQAKTILYDDISCGLKWREKQCTTAQINFDANAMVYDYYNSTAIAIKDAVFVRANTVKSPMGSGLLAFANNENAEKFLAEKGSGKKMSFEELLKQ